MRRQLFDDEQKLFDATEDFNPNKDLQEYIMRCSVYQEPNDLVDLYKDKGLVEFLILLGLNLVPKSELPRANS